MDKTIAAIISIFKDFFRRDLAYVFSGMISLWILDYFGKIGQLDFSHETLKDMNWIEFILFAVAAYFVGFILSEWGDRLGIVDKRISTKSWDKNNKIKERTREYTHKHLKIASDKNMNMSLLERSVGLLHIGASIGPAIFFSLMFAFLLRIREFECCFLLLHKDEWIMLIKSVLLNLYQLIQEGLPYWFWIWPSLGMVVILLVGILLIVTICKYKDEAKLEDGLSYGMLFLISWIFHFDFVDRLLMLGIMLFGYIAVLDARLQFKIADEQRRVLASATRKRDN